MKVLFLVKDNIIKQGQGKCIVEAFNNMLVNDLKEQIMHGPTNKRFGLYEWDDVKRIIVLDNEGNIELDLLGQCTQMVDVHNKTMDQLILVYEGSRPLIK